MPAVPTGTQAAAVPGGEMAGASGEPSVKHVKWEKAFLSKTQLSEMNTLNSHV